jgi:hypothetical protein
MKKFITSIFLILSLVTTGLMSYTPSVSAINKDPRRCDFLGQYINRSTSENKCEPCPENSYCPLISGVEISDCRAKLFSPSECTETRKIFSTDKAIPCPAGTSTRGYTYNTLQGTRIIAAGDLFPIGQGATDVSMCKAPDFKCDAATPVLLKGVDGVAKCYPANTCNADQVPILKDGIPDCSVACKSNTIISGKCYQNCPAGEFLEVRSTTVNGEATQTALCTKIKVIPTTCPIIGQIPTTPGDITTCICVAPQTLSADKSKCENPIIPCPAPQTGNQPNCVNPITPCPANQYGYAQPNCTPCPNGGTSPAGTVDSSGCILPNVPCPVNTYKANNIACIPCPPNSTSPVGTTSPTGCIAAQNNGGGFDWGWAALGAGLLVATDCFLTHIVCKSGGSSTSNPVTGKPQPHSRNTTSVAQDKLVVRKVVTKAVVEKCQGTNQDFATTVFNSNGADAHTKNGDQYLWVATHFEGGREISMSTIRPAGGKYGVSKSKANFDSKSVDENLKCLMLRFAAKNNVQLGSSEYMNALKNAGCVTLDKFCGVLHGRNLTYDLECINLSRLVYALGKYGEDNVGVQGSEKFKIWNETQNSEYNLDLYDSSNEAITVIDSIRPRGQSNQVIRKQLKPMKKPTFFNIFGAISASAQEDSDPALVKSNATAGAEQSDDISFGIGIGSSYEIGEIVYTAQESSSEATIFTCNGQDIVINDYDSEDSINARIEAAGCYNEVETDSPAPVNQVNQEFDSYCKSQFGSKYSYVEASGYCEDLVTSLENSGTLTEEGTKGYDAYCKSQFGSKYSYVEASGYCEDLVTSLDDLSVNYQNSNPCGENYNGEATGNGTCQYSEPCNQFYGGNYKCETNPNNLDTSSSTECPNNKTFSVYSQSCQSDEESCGGYYYNSTCYSLCPSGQYNYETTCRSNSLDEPAPQISAKDACDASPDTTWNDIINSCIPYTSSNNLDGAPASYDYSSEKNACNTAPTTIWRESTNSCDTYYSNLDE